MKFWKVNQTFYEGKKCPIKGVSSGVELQMRNKGFTLIELLVVIAILAILMVIALPNFIGIRDSARQSARKHQKLQIHIFVLQNPSDNIPFPNQDPDIEITETNQHDSWNRYFTG